MQGRSAAFAARVLVGLAPLLAGCGEPATAKAESTGVRRVLIQGQLDRGHQAQLHRAIELAAASGDALIVELDTLGGEIELMIQMGKELLASSERGVQTLAWVNEHALSAGSYLAMACERLYMRPQATLGDAYPVRIGVGGLLPVSQDEGVKEKEVAFVRAKFRALAEARHRPPVLAEAMVDPKIEVVRLEIEGALQIVSATEYDDMRARGLQPAFRGTVVSAGSLLAITGTQAVDLGLADGLADSLDEVVLKLGRGPLTPLSVERSRSEDLARLLFALSPWLVIAGLALIYVEIKTPGFGVEGILAIACFAAVFFGRWLVGLADALHFVLLFAGAGLLAVELLLAPGTIWFGIAGVVCLLAGLFLSIGGSFEGPLERAILLGELRRFLLAGFAALLLIWGLSRVLPRTPLLGRMVLAPAGRATGAALRDAQGHSAELARVGSLGRALTALRPVGKVVLDGDAALEFEARASGPEIARGLRVRVVEVEGGRLLVEAEPERAAPASSA
jgi:membrane-bound serine protease (ClpP class)